MSDDDLLTWLRAHPLAREVTPRRLQRIAAVVTGRLSSVTVVLENLSDPHNASAVLRTAEGFGVDAMHVVEQPNSWQVNRAITKGADRWVQVVRHRELSRCMGELSARGYHLCAADVGEGCVPLDQIPVLGNVAIVFGSEHAGLSKRALQWAQTRFTIPMNGFVESFNVSVSAAVTLYDVARRRRAHLGVPGDLSPAEARARADAFLRRSVKNEALILRTLQDAAKRGDEAG